MLLLCFCYTNLVKITEKVNLFTIHDCFFTTADKSIKLITIIWFIYIKIYIDEPYLRTFYEGIINMITINYNKSATWKDKETMLIYKNKEILLHDLEWVLGNILYDDKYKKNRWKIYSKSLK